MIFRYNKSFILNVDDPKDMPVLIIPTRLNLVSFIKNQSWIITTVGWHHRLSAHESEQTPEMVRVGEAWRAAVHGIAESRTQLCDRTTARVSLKFI